MSNLAKEMSLQTFWTLLELVWIFKSQSISYDLIRPMPSVFFFSLLREAFLKFTIEGHILNIFLPTQIYMQVGKLSQRSTLLTSSEGFFPTV